jgi:hypothetical protein
MTMAAEPATAARQLASDAGAAQDLGRLVRSDPAAGGIRRRRCGRGFRYLGPAAPVTDPEILARIKALVIPPAWEDVWICADPRGHIQAMGTDAAGRRQYRYHDLWREQRDRDKHDRVLGVGAALPHLREAVDQHLEAPGLSRDRVLAAAVRLVDADRCSHLSGPLSEGDYRDGCLSCPWHGSTFRVSDGTVARGPATAPQPAFRTRITGGTLQACLPGAG